MISSGIPARFEPPKTTSGEPPVVESKPMDLFGTKPSFEEKLIKLVQRAKTEELGRFFLIAPNNTYDFTNLENINCVFSVIKTGYLPSYASFYNPGKPPAYATEEQSENFVTEIAKELELEFKKWPHKRYTHYDFVLPERVFGLKKRLVGDKPLFNRVYESKELAVVGDKLVLITHD